MADTPFKAYWDVCQVSHEHKYSSNRIGVETRLLSEIHSFLRLEPLLTPLTRPRRISRNQRAQQVNGNESHTCTSSNTPPDETTVHNRVKTVREILKEMTSLPEMLSGLSDDEEDDDEDDADDDFEMMEACALIEEVVTGAEEPDVQELEADVPEITTHCLSMPSLLSFEDIPRRRTTIEVIPDPVIHVKSDSCDLGTAQERLRSCQSKYETVRASRGQYVKKRDQNVRTLDDEMLRLLQDASRGFQFKLNQALDSNYCKKLDPKTFVPEELVSGVLVRLKEDSQPHLPPQMCLALENKRQRKRMKRAGSVCSLSSSSSFSSNMSICSSSSSSSPGIPLTRYSLTHNKSKLMRIDHSVDDSLQVYRNQMKASIDRADLVQEVISLRQALKQKEKALRSSK